MNKRANPRHGLLLRAQLTIVGCLPTNCILQDFSFGGAYLTCGVMTFPRCNPGDRFELSVRVSGKTYQLSGRLAYLMDGALGVEFMEPNPAALVALKKTAEGEYETPDMMEANCAEEQKHLSASSRKGRRIRKKELPVKFEAKNNDYRTASQPQKDSQSQKNSQSQSPSIYPTAFIDNGVKKSPKLQDRLRQQITVVRKVYDTAHELLQIGAYRKFVVEGHQNSGQMPSYNDYLKALELTPPAYSEKEMLAALTQLQLKNAKKLFAQDKQRLIEKSKGVRGLELKQDIEKILSEGSVLPKKINGQVAEKCDVLERVFDTIISNAALSEEIKPVLYRLLVPTLKIFIIDNTLLVSNFHPVRQVINCVARLGLRHSNSADPKSADSKLFVKSLQLAEWAVGQITTNVESGLTVFSQVLEKMELGLVEQERIYRKNLEEVLVNYHRPVQQKDAERALQEEIRYLLKDKKAPQIIFRLLDVGWRELLLQSYIQYGEDDDTWIMGLQVIEQLYWRLISKSQSKPLAPPPRSNISSANLLKLISKGLRQVSSSASAQRGVLLIIKDCLQGGGKRSKMVDVESQLGLLRAEKSIYLNSGKGRATESVSSDKWVVRSKQIQKGEWLVFDLPGENMHRARLAWTSNAQDLFVFVNHEGLKVIEQSLEALAINMSKGDVWSVVYRDLPIVDQALDIMVQRVYEQTVYEATHDEVTELVNDKELLRWLGSTIVRTRCDGTANSFIYLELGPFKEIDGSVEYESSEKILKQIGGILVNKFSDNGGHGCVASLGDNAFAILLEHCDDEQGTVFAEELIKVFRTLRFMWGRAPFEIDIRASLLMIKGGDVASKIVQASALACVDREWGSLYRLYDHSREEDTRTAQNEKSWVVKATRAFSKKNLQLRVQRLEPLTQMASKRMYSNLYYEVLKCLKTEEGPQYLPADLVGVGADADKLGQIDRWVIKTVFRWMGANAAKLEDYGRFLITLSAGAVNDIGLANFILTESRINGVSRYKICFEMTESAAIVCMADTADFINEIKAIGCQFSLGQVGGLGAGMSSYTYFKNLPVDFIRIDGSFVEGIAVDINDFAMVKAITEMGHLMGKKVMVGSVVSKTILEKLKEVGVDYVQGLEIEKPCWVFDGQT